ncbi:unnamed protein product [Calypogeia fissa]
MLGLLATMAVVRSPAGRTLLRCLAIVGILVVYKYLIFVKIIIACLVISEIAAWIIPFVTPTRSERSSTTSTFFTPESNISDNDDSHTGPYRPHWRQDERKQEEEIHERDLKQFSAQPEGSPTNFMPNFVVAPNISSESIRAVPTRSSNRRQKEDIDRHLQRLAMAAAAAEAAAAGTVNLGTSPSFNDRIIGGYQETAIGGTFDSDTFTFSNLSATQGDTSPEIGHFWTRNKFPVSPTPITAPQTTSNHLRYGAPGLGHSKSLPEPAKRYVHEDFYQSWKDR